jgi:hypothetical protein
LGTKELIVASIFDSELVKWAGVIMAVPVAYVWKRAVGSVQKDELTAAIAAINKNHDEHAEQDRERFAGIFARIDRVAESTARIEGYIQAQAERRQD